jgi:hypothetical protein
MRVVREAAAEEEGHDHWEVFFFFFFPFFARASNMFSVAHVMEVISFYHFLRLLVTLSWWFFLRVVLQCGIQQVVSSFCFWRGWQM